MKNKIEIKISITLFFIENGLDKLINVIFDKYGYQNFIFILEIFINYFITTLFFNPFIIEEEIVFKVEEKSYIKI